MRALRPEFVRWSLLIPVLVALWTLGVVYARAARRRSPIADRFRSLSRPSTFAGALAVLICGVGAAAGLVFALVRPQALLAARVPDYDRQDVIFVLDRSASMRAQDVQPSRFRRATAEIRHFLLTKPDTVDRIGLVGFADASVVLSYLTSDLDSLRFYLDWIDEDPTALLGTNIGAALRSAREVAAKDDRQTPKLFLLISDGEEYGTELDGALATFRGEHRRIHCIGIGSDNEVPVPLRRTNGQEEFLRDDAGRIVTTKFGESTLRSIAAATGGRYVRSATGSELAGAIAAIIGRERTIVGWHTSTDYRDLYRWGLAVAAGAGAVLSLLL